MGHPRRVFSLCRLFSGPCPSGVPLFSVKWVSDVHGRGSTPGQYAANLKACLEKATAEVRGLFADV